MKEKNCDPPIPPPSDPDIGLKAHDSWEAWGWIRTEFSGLYRSRTHKNCDFMYVCDQHGYEEEVRIKYSKGYFHLDGWTLKSRENKFGSLEELADYFHNKMFPNSCPAFEASSD